MILKAIYRQTIASIRRAHLDFLTYGAKMMTLNEGFNASLKQHHQEMKVIAHDEQILPEKKYILLCALLDKVEQQTQAHLAQVDELKRLEGKLQLDIQTFIERCSADHPELDREVIASTVIESLK